MKYPQLRRGLPPEEAAAYVGSKELLGQFERAKWLKPFIRGNRLTRFDIRDPDACIDRLKAGELTSEQRGPRSYTVKAFMISRSSGRNFAIRNADRHSEHSQSVAAGGADR